MDCRICQEQGDSSDLIVPCACKGSCKYVHRKCLDTWRETDTDESLTRCPNCHTEYQFDIEITKSREYYIAKFLVFFESAAMFAFIQLLLILLSYMIYKYDSDKHIQKEYCQFLKDDEIKTCYYITSFMFITIAIIITIISIAIIGAILGSANGGGGSVIIINNGGNSGGGMVCGTMSKGLMIFSSIALLLVGISVVCMIFICYINYVINKHIGSIGKRKYVKLMKVKNLESTSLIV